MLKTKIDNLGSLPKLIFIPSLPKSFLILYDAGPRDGVSLYDISFLSVPNFVTGTFNDERRLYRPTPGVVPSS